MVHVDATRRLGTASSLHGRCRGEGGQAGRHGGMGLHTTRAWPTSLLWLDTGAHHHMLWRDASRGTPSKGQWCVRLTPTPTPLPYHELLPDGGCCVRLHQRLRPPRLQH